LKKLKKPDANGQVAEASGALRDMGVDAMNKLRAEIGLGPLKG